MTQLLSLVQGLQLSSCSNSQTPGALQAVHVPDPCISPSGTQKTGLSGSGASAGIYVCKEVQKVTPLASLCQGAGGLGPGVTAGVTVTSTYLLVHGEPDTMREALHEVIFV